MKLLVWSAVLLAFAGLIGGAHGGPPSVMKYKGVYWRCAGWEHKGSRRPTVAGGGRGPSRVMYGKRGYFLCSGWTKETEGDKVTTGNGREKRDTSSQPKRPVPVEAGSVDCRGAALASVNCPWFLQPRSRDGCHVCPKGLDEKCDSENPCVKHLKCEGGFCKGADRRADGSACSESDIKGCTREIKFFSATTCPYCSKRLNERCFNDEQCATEQECVRTQRGKVCRCRDNGEDCKRMRGSFEAGDETASGCPICRLPSGSNCHVDEFWWPYYRCPEGEYCVGTDGAPLGTGPGAGTCQTIPM